MNIVVNIDETKLKKAAQRLIDNGLEPDEAETVLQAIGYILLGYILLDKQLYPADKEGEACVNMAISINEAKLKKTEQCLIDNGIASDEAETVLQAIGYILLDKELYPANKEGEACVNMAISINEAKLKKAEQCLIDNGIEPDEAETVLQAIGYILLDKELYPATRED